MSNRILLGCYEIPGWGGAATVCYLLFERMQKAGMDVSYVNLVYEKDEVLLRYLFGNNFGNPRNLDNVRTCILKDPLWRAHADLTAVIDAAAPDILFGFGFIAARLLRMASPSKSLIFMTAGCTQLRRLIELGAIKDFMDFKDAAGHGVVFPLQDKQERRALLESDLAIVHSPLVRFAFEHFFPRQQGKIYSRTISIADVIYQETEPYHRFARPFAERDIDVLFIASVWQRPEKNYGLVRSIASRCKDLNVHIIGEADRTQPAAKHHNVVAERERVFELLGRSKTVVCPSLLDAAPGILFEASAMGCNVIASPNCGNWELCNDELVARRCTTDDFVARIRAGVKGSYEDNRQRFRGDCEDLIDTLNVF